MESPALDQTWLSDEINVRAWKRTQLYEMYNNSETGLCVFEHTIMINVFLQKKRLTEFWRTARKSYFLHGDWNLHKSTREDAHIHTFLASRIFNIWFTHSISLRYQILQQVLTTLFRRCSSQADNPAFHTVQLHAAHY